MKTLTKLLFICLIALGMATSHAAETPNIILILVDNLGRDSIGCYGGNHATPTLTNLPETEFATKLSGACLRVPQALSRC